MNTRKQWWRQKVWEYFIMILVSLPLNAIGWLVVSDTFEYKVIVVGVVSGIIAKAIADKLVRRFLLKRPSDAIGQR